MVSPQLLSILQQAFPPAARRPGPVGDADAQIVACLVIGCRLPARNLRHLVRLLDWCLGQGVTTLYVGDLSGIERRAQGRRHRQRMHFWRRSRLLRRLTQFGVRYGIRVVVIPERGTSRTCPACGAKRKPSGRVLRCPNGHTAHRDVVGAVNILARGLWGGLPLGRPMPRQQETTYLRPDRKKAQFAA